MIALLLLLALCVVKQPNKIKRNVQLCSINLLGSVLSVFTAVFCLSVLFLASLGTGLDQRGFSVNERWQIRDNSNLPPRTPPVPQTRQKSCLYP